MRRSIFHHGLMLGASALVACTNGEIPPADAGPMLEVAFGQVYDLRGLPAKDLEVSFAPQGASVRTDERGGFLATKVPMKRRCSSALKRDFSVQMAIVVRTSPSIRMAWSWTTV